MAGYGGEFGAQEGGGSEDNAFGGNQTTINPFANLPKPNYINPETRAPLVIGFNISFVLLALIVVILRVWSRRVILGYLNPEDWLIVAAWFFSFALSFWLCYATKFGMGRHLWDIPFDWFPKSAVAGYVFTALYNPTLTLIKTSILLIYLRLSPSKQFRMYCLTTMALVIAVGVSISLVLLFPCMPVSASWSFVPGAKCINQMQVYVVGGVLNTVTDAIILVLPMPILLKVRLPKKEKIAVNSMFGLGIFVVITSIVRVILVVKANNSKDFVYEGALSAMASGIEVNVAIICASLPAIRPFIKRWFPKLLTQSDKSDSDSTRPFKFASNGSNGSFSPPYSTRYLVEKPLPETPKLPILKHMRSNSGLSSKSYGVNSYIFSGDHPPIPSHLAFVKTKGIPARSLQAADFPIPPAHLGPQSPASPAHLGPGITKKVEFKVDTRKRSLLDREFLAWQNRNA